jgi:hypothetical protein
MFMDVIFVMPIMSKRDEVFDDGSGDIEEGRIIVIMAVVNMMQVMVIVVVGMMKMKMLVMMTLLITEMTLVAIQFLIWRLWRWYMIVIAMVTNPVRGLPFW